MIELTAGPTRGRRRRPRPAGGAAGAAENRGEGAGLRRGLGRPGGRSEDPLGEVEELEPGGELEAAVGVPVGEVVEGDEVVAARWTAASSASSWTSTGASPGSSTSSGSDASA